MSAIKRRACPPLPSPPRYKLPFGPDAFIVSSGPPAVRLRRRYFIGPYHLPAPATVA